MIRGTTPTHEFVLPFDVSVIEKIRIVYAQGGAVKLVKTNADLVMDATSVKVKLTQEDTLRFVSAGDAQVQLRILTAAGDALASEPQTVAVKRLLEDGVI